MAKQTTLDDLAGMVAEGFANTATKVDIARLDKRIDSIDESLKTLEDGQEQIKLKLDNVAYRFELVELQRRVELLEKKVGMKN